MKLTGSFDFVVFEFHLLRNPSFRDRAVWIQEKQYNPYMESFIAWGRRRKRLQKRPLSRIVYFSCLLFSASDYHRTINGGAAQPECPMPYLQKDTEIRFMLVMVLECL